MEQRQKRRISPSFVHFNANDPARPALLRSTLTVNDGGERERERENGFMGKFQMKRSNCGTDGRTDGPTKESGQLRKYRNEGKIPNEHQNGLWHRFAYFCASATSPYRGNGGQNYFYSCGIPSRFVCGTSFPARNLSPHYSLSE